MSALIVAPTRREAAACGPEARVVGAGLNAAKALDERLSRGDVSLVLIAGVCGGLDPSLATGGLILCRRVVAPGRSELAPDSALFEAARRRLRTLGLPFISSVLLTVARPVGSLRAKTAFWNEYGAAGVDMETWLLARAAAGRGVPWLALRAVLDPATATLPHGLLAWRGENDERAIARHIALHPLDWPAYTRLALELRRALRSLGAAAPAVAEVASAALDLRIDVVG